MLIEEYEERIKDNLSGWYSTLSPSSVKEYQKLHRSYVRFSGIAFTEKRIKKFIMSCSKSNKVYLYNKACNLYTISHYAGFSLNTAYLLELKNKLQKMNPMDFEIQKVKYVSYDNAKKEKNEKERKI